MIATTRDGHVVVIELQREDRRNALNLELCHAIRAAVDDAVASDARVVVITGKGSAFCSGADLTGVHGPDFLDALYGMLHHLTKLPVPLIAAVNGPAIGAGTQLAMACDLRVADDKAKFAVPVARNGMAVDAWTIRTLGDLAGAGPARRMMLAAETLERKEALDCGLADAHGGLKYAVAWAHEIARLAPLAVAHSKLVLNGSTDDDAEIEKSFDAVWASADVQEAAQARVERRAPVFQGAMMESLVFRVLDAHVIHGRADEIAIHDELGTKSYAQLLHESACIGAGLHHMGVEPGTPVQVDLAPGRDLVVAVLALARIGGLPAVTADFRIAGTPPVLHAPDTEVTWDVLDKAGRTEPHPAPVSDLEGYEEAMRAAYGDIPKTLEAGKTITTT